MVFGQIASFSPPNLAPNYHTSMTTPKSKYSTKISKHKSKSNPTKINPTPHFSATKNHLKQTQFLSKINPTLVVCLPQQ
jgi:hypothetical protein